VADVTIIFQNNEILELLEKRGEAIRTRDFDKQKKYGVELTNYVRTHKEEMCTPYECFITMD